MNERILVSFLLSLSGGLWMIASGRMMYGNFHQIPMNDGWGMGNTMLGSGMMAQFGLWWPWFGLLAGSVIIVSALFLYIAPQYRRSLGSTILVTSILNLFLGMGGLLASVLGITGGVVASTSKVSSHE